MEPKDVHYKVNIVVLNRIEVGVLARQYLRNLSVILMLAITIEKFHKRHMCMCDCVGMCLMA